MAIVSLPDNIQYEKGAKMTNKEFENYLTLVSRLLRLKRGQTEQIAGELRDHLELRVAELTESGVSADEATRIALEEFGDAASLAGQFQFISETYQRRWMMRFATLSIAGLFLTALLVMAMWPSGTRFGAPDSTVASDSSFVAPGSKETTAIVPDEISMSDSTRRTKEARKALLKEYAFDDQETEFGEILDRLEAEFGVPFILDQTAQDDSLSYDEPITFRVAGVPANKALRLLLKPHNATYVIHDGIVKIISLDVEDDPDFFARRIFDVSDLLARITELEADRIGQVRGGGIGGGGFGGGSRGGGLFCYIQDESASEAVQESNEKDSEANSQKTDSPAVAGGGGFGGGGGGIGGQVKKYITAETLLVDAIKKTVVADSWDNTNGDGTIEVLGGLMIVNQTEEANEKIEELLQDLSFRFAQREDIADK